MAETGTPVERELPQWGERGRRITRAALNVWTAVWVLGFLTKLVASFCGADNDDLRHTMLYEWPGALVGWSWMVGFFGSLAVVIVAGCFWLAGSAAAGYSEPRPQA
ncbi:hypothetical protein BH09ACT10_BH09ACT10_26220 [soil metagenome]